ncbi:hypothetical protein BGY98DRAFT_277159 [Russula aff. rugulosa BPL654]|nr:hypothetical protein BGY98DRAFT_277159 [Russula aff. rugulosa BPL654]
MSSLPPIPRNIAEITAPLLAAAVWNWCLFGVLVVQTYVYSYNFPEDRRRLKLLVCAVFALETVQTVLTGADVYYWFASGYGDLNRLSTPFASAIDVPIMGSIVSAMVQFFYAYRVWILSNKKRWLFTFICLSSIVNAVAAFTIGIHTQVKARFSTSDRSLRHIAAIWLSATVLSDILIASSMVYFLTRRQKDTNGFIQNNFVTKLVRLTVESNLLTTSVGIVSLLVFIIFPNKNWYTCPTAILGKLYSIALLVSLNNRISIRDATGNLVVSRKLPIELAVTTSTMTRTDSGTEISGMGSGRSSAMYKISGRWEV